MPCDLEGWRRAGELLHGGLLPLGAGLQPEDCGDDGFPAIAGRLAIEVLCHLGIGFGVPMVEFVAVVLAERLGIDTDDPAISASGMP